VKIALSWLAELATLPADPAELAERLTAAGLESEVERPPAVPEGVVTGKIVSCEPHPNADRLSVCRVDTGDGEPRTVVCGAPNAAAGPVGACAVPGAKLGEFEIAERKLRGVLSQGMLCSESELGLSDDHSGILLLPGDTPVGRPLAEVLGREAVLVTEPTSNRGDWMSVLGVAREIRAVSGEPFAEARPGAPAAPDAGGWSVEIEDGADCPRYCGRVIEGLRSGPSPAWLADRLRAAGIRPLSNLVDVTNYVLLERGHPLHAFDLDLLQGKTIGVRRGRKGERLVTLDDKERELGPEVLVITDGSGPVATAGLMGGASTRVSDGTERVFLEGASFTGPRIRAGARALRLTTDASQRFERGVDPEGVPDALDRAVELLLGLCPGARVTASVDSYPAPVERAGIGLRRVTLRRILGQDLPAAEVRSILERLGVEVAAESDDGWKLIPPTFRRDLLAEEDFVEEVGRIHGWDRFPDEVTVRADVHHPDVPRWDAQERARASLLAVGMTEVVMPPLVDSAAETGLTGGGEPFYRPPVVLRNPMSRDRDALRGALVPSLLVVLGTNVSRSQHDLALFEVSRVFRGSAEEGVEERLRAALLLAGRGLAAEGGMGAKSCDFFDMKGLVEVYVEEFWGASPTLEAGAPAPFAPGRSATVKVGGKPVGHLGEIAPAARNRFDVPEELPVIAAELDLESVARRRGEAVFRELPRYPGVLRDLAFVVPRRVRHADLASALAEAGGSLLRESRLFDVYEGRPLGDGEKSLAFTLVFRSPERSLTHEEVDERVKEIVAHVERELGGRIR
jgi:phenylalanyl-tRNA synthetase beta chain